MNEIEIPQCSFSQYYGFSAKITRITDYLELVNRENEFPFQKTGNKKTDFDYAHNMTELGLINRKEGFYYLTPRGFSILIVKDIVDSKHVWKNQLIKFCIIKALADLDWDCLTSILWYRQILKKDINALKEIFKPSFSERNFRDHWLRMHLNLLKNTDVVSNYLKLVNKYVSLGENKESAHKKTSIDINPYYEGFIGQLYFIVNYTFSGDDAKIFVQKVLPSSLKIYDQYFDQKEIGNFEPLKSLIVSYSLRDNRYISEIEVSEILFNLFISNNVPIYKVLLDLRYSGRGIFHKTNKGLDYYPDFNLYVALKKFL